MEELGRQNPRAKKDLGKLVFLINLDGQLLLLFWLENHENKGKR
jgi:hypothetical protein